MDPKFKDLARKANSLLKKDFDISLNFKGYNQLLQDYENIDSIDLYSLNELIKESNEWASYFSELRNFLTYYEDLYKIKSEIYVYLSFIHKQDIKKNDKKLTKELKNKYKILKCSDDDILEELNIKLRQARIEYKIIKGFNSLLDSRRKFLERIFFTSVREYGKNLFDLHFK